ncbi:hypothetical protein D9758_007948 [Tetrapyrgos nigripes]|uniref:Uncharacterized protein n=1 Tax=Tetrapyrgos nigripes TaxID=182062 RepID=A0A8H5D467_9AGAR|nr:hypothetical protein D9758_007948 [Tetrapyrgos nigripes]
MPPQRQVFEGVDDEYIRCLPCSSNSDTRDCIIKKEGRFNHVRTQKHKEALKALDTSLPAAAIDVPIPTPVPARIFAVLPHSDTLDQILAEDSDAEVELSRNDLLQDVRMDSGTCVDNFGNPYNFSAGQEELNQLEQEDIKLNARLDDLGLLRTHTLFGTFGDSETAQSTTLDDVNDEESETAGIARAIEALVFADEDAERTDDGFDAGSQSSDWFPHMSKTMFMLDLLDNLPRLRLSDDHLKSILWVMQMCGTPDVPSFSALRKTQASIASMFKMEPKHHLSALGNHFFMTHPAKLIALDWSNPLVRKHIHVYPELSEVVSETWQAAKWVEEVGVEQLSPMWADWQSAVNCHRHFYVNEVAQTVSGSYVFIKRWVTVKKNVHVEVWEVDSRELESNQLQVTIKSNELHQLSACSLARNTLDIHCTYRNGIVFNDATPVLANPLRSKAEGRPMFRIRIVPWSDDVSGNVSKQYNAHTNIYITNASIPHQKLSQEYFIRFCSTSGHASSSEQFVALCEDFETDTWHTAYDCELKQDIFFQLLPHFLPADNPQQSETASHIGVNGNSICRRDYIGGSEVEKEKEAGYEALYHPGIPRTSHQTIRSIREQVWEACGGNHESVKELQTSTGVKDKIAQFWIEQLLEHFKEVKERRITNWETRDAVLNDRDVKGDARKAEIIKIRAEIQKQLWDWVVGQQSVSDHDSECFHYNILLKTPGVDPHQDTPGEMLHTYLLGNDKYVWHNTSRDWNKDNELTFAIRLQSSCLHGLSIPPPRASYMVQYKNSLIGKHFKALQQLAVFHLRDLCSDELFQLWKATGELGAFLWMPEIRNMDLYLSDLRILIDNVLDVWAKVDPRRIITKIKLHVLPHLPEDIRRFGPSVIFATEIYECFNAVFRLCSILSNHLAPSRDIAVTLAGTECFKHIVSGGYWKDAGGNDICAGRLIQDFFKSNLELQRRLGWADSEAHIRPGQVKLAPALRTTRKRMSLSWDKCIKDFHIEDTAHLENPGAFKWNPCTFVVSRSKDLCYLGCWVFVKDERVTHNYPGRIVRIIAKENEPILPENTLLVIECFNVLNEKDKHFNMPVLLKTEKHTVVSPKHISFDFNAQHDCVSGACEIGFSSQRIRQERIDTDQQERHIVHSDDDRYILNIHALHNAHLIREVLPRELVAPVPLYPLDSDREAFHRELSAALQVSGQEKRQLTKAKAQATRERNKKAKATPLA